MEIFQLMVFVIPVFSALSRPVFFLVGRRDFVYENKAGAKVKTRPKIGGKKTVNKYQLKMPPPFSIDYINKPRFGSKRAFHFLSLSQAVSSLRRLVWKSALTSPVWPSPHANSQSVTVASCSLYHNGHTVVRS